MAIDLGNDYAKGLVQRMQETAAHLPGTIDAELLSMDELAQHVLEAEGDIGLVAERLLGSRARQDMLLRSLTADAGAFDAFALKARMLIMTKLIHTFCMLEAHVAANMGELKPDEAARIMIKTADTIASLSKRENNSINTQINIVDAVLRQVPEPLRPAFERVLTAIPENKEDAA